MRDISVWQGKPHNCKSHEILCTSANISQIHCEWLPLHPPPSIQRLVWLSYLVCRWKVQSVSMLHWIATQQWKKHSYKNVRHKWAFISPPWIRGYSGVMHHKLYRRNRLNQLQVESQFHPVCVYMWMCVFQSWITLSPRTAHFIVIVLSVYRVASFIRVLTWSCFLGCCLYI